MWCLNDFAKPDVNYPEYCSNALGVYLLSRATVSYSVYGSLCHILSNIDHYINKKWIIDNFLIIWIWPLSISTECDLDYIKLAVPYTSV